MESLIPLKTDEVLAEEFIDQTEAGESIFKSLYKAVRHKFWKLVWCGIFFGFGAYFGKIYCGKYILP